MKSKNIVFLNTLPVLEKYNRRWVKSAVKYEGTFMQLFKTNSYKRNLKHQEFIRRRMDNYVKKHITNNYWQGVRVRNSNSKEERGYALIY